MNKNNKIEIEILNGPLDGFIIVIESDAEWTRLAGGLLAFPWDDELGQPQSRILFEEDKWLIEPISSAHGTYIFSREIKLSDKTVLQKGDILKASRTWILIKSFE